MSSRNRSSSALGLRDYIPSHLLNPRKTSTAYSRSTEDPIRTRSRSVSRNPANRVPLRRATEEAETRRTSFPATFESLADPQFSTPDTPTPKPAHRPIRGILRNPGQSSYQNQNHSAPRYVSSVSFGQPSQSQGQTATPTRSLFANPSYSPVSKARTMSGRATARAKASDATAIKDAGSSTARGAKNLNGTRLSKKAIASSDEGSSSSDEDSSDSSSDDSSSDSSDEESTASERESKKGPQKSAATQLGSTKKPAISAAATNRGQKESSSDEDSDTSSDSEAESGGGAKVAPVREIPDSSTDSSSEEESEESEAEDRAKAEPSVSSSSSEEEDEEESDEEMEDAPPSGQAPFNSSNTSRAGILTSNGGAPVPAPSTMDGGFKLQKAQNLGQMAALLSEANAKGDRVWLLTHPSSTPLNLEVQHVFSAPEHHRNSIVPNGVKLTYPVSADGKNFHAISGCSSITVTQTTRNDTDMSSITQAVSKSLMSAKEAPAQPAGLRSRYLPIGVGSRASPTLEDSPEAALPSAAKNEKKKDKTGALSSDERPSKKRKVAAESNGQPAAERDSEKSKKSSRKSKTKETPTKASSAKSKVKFASDDAARSSTPVPLPTIPSSQIKETPSSQPKSDKKKRRLSNDGAEASAPASSEKKEKKKEKKKRATPSSSWSRPDDVKVTPVAPPSIPGMR